MFSILVYSDIISLIKELSRDIQRHSEGCVTPAYSEPWHIQNPGIFRTLPYSDPFSTFVYSVSQAYSQPCQTFAIKRFPKTIEILFRTIYNYIYILRILEQFGTQYYI